MAGVTLGYLRYVLGLDTLQFRKGMTEAERDLAVFGKKMQRAGDTMKNLGKGLSAFLTLPVAAFGASAFKAASDAEELQNTFNNTFGSMAAGMNAWAEATGNALGRSTQELQKAANDFGLFFNTAASPEKAAAMSKQFAVLAEDIGSAFNIDADTAMQKLRSGLAGESEPLRDFGVFLTEAGVKAKAMALGLADSNGAVSEQNKVLARAAIIMEQTKKAQGDLERTQGSTANQLKALGAAWSEFQVAFGEKLLPMFTPVISAFTKIIDVLANLPAPIQGVIVGVLGFGAALGPLTYVLGSVVGTLGKVGPAAAATMKAWKGLQLAWLAARVAALDLIPALVPILAPLAAVAAAVGVAYLAWKNWDKIVAIVSRVYTGVKTWLQDKLASVFNWVKEKLEAVGGWFFHLYDRVVGHSYIPDMVEAIGQHMARLDAVMVEPAKAATGAAAEAFRDLQQRAQSLFDVLFPRQAAENQLNRDIATLRAYAAAAKLPVDQLEEAIGRLQDRFNEQAPARTNIFGQTDDEALSELMGSIPASEILAVNLDTILKKTNAWKEVLSNVATDLGNLFGDHLAAIIEGTGTLRDLWKDLLGYAIRALTSQSGPLQQLFGGARATGGPVASGVPYLVGEQGPEIFIPGAGGRILSNGDSRRAVGAMGGGTVNNWNITTPDADSFKRSERQIVRGMSRRMAAAR